MKQQVYQLVKTIPRGKVSTYKSLAEQLNTTAYRRIGQILKQSPSLPQVPCHRIINSDGTLGGFNQGIKKKIQLLQQEGIIIKNNKIDLGKYLFRF